MSPGEPHLAGKCAVPLQAESEVYHVVHEEITFPLGLVFCELLELGRARRGALYCMLI